MGIGMGQSGTFNTKHDARWHCCAFDERWMFPTSAQHSADPEDAEKTGPHYTDFSEKMDLDSSQQLTSGTVYHFHSQRSRSIAGFEISGGIDYYALICEITDVDGVVRDGPK